MCWWYKWRAPSSTSCTKSAKHLRHYGWNLGHSKRKIFVCKYLYIHPPNFNRATEKLSSQKESSSNHPFLIFFQVYVKLQRYIFVYILESFQKMFWNSGTSNITGRSLIFETHPCWHLDLMFEQKTPRHRGITLGDSWVVMIGGLSSVNDLIKDPDSVSEKLQHNSDLSPWKNARPRPAKAYSLSHPEELKGHVTLVLET